MKRSNWRILVCMLGSAVLVSCGYPGVPIPPALELAKPVTDLRAARKGDRVFLAWTVPARTTDHQTVRHPGVTRVCRSLNSEIGDCKTSVREIPPAQFPVPAFDSKKGAPAPKIQASYVDALPEKLQTQYPAGEFTYAVSVLNESGRSAGLSNLVQVPSAPTLPPPERFNAEIKGDGVLVSWSCPATIAVTDPRIDYRLRIYRRGIRRKLDTGLPAPNDAKPTSAKIGDMNFADCSQPQFLDQS